MGPITHQLTSTQETINVTQQSGSPQESSSRPPLFPAVALAVTVALLGVATLAGVLYRYSDTWRQLLGWFWQNPDQQDVEKAPAKQETSLRISHSLPDLQPVEPVQLEYVQEAKVGIKKVLRQTTLPTEPIRHQVFHRQLSHRLDIPKNVEFSICSLENRSNSSTIGLIRPELYKQELVRQSSVESDGPELENCGKLRFSLRYDRDVDGLFVKVLEARDLPMKDGLGKGDPYVKIFLLPDSKKKFCTKVHRKNINPIFNETFIFSIPFDELRHKDLQFSVYDFDRFSRHDLIGHVVLKDISQCVDSTEEVDYIMDILCPPQDQTGLGELMLSLCYLPTAGRLTLTVIKAYGLKSMDITGKSDPYVKAYLLCQGKRIKKRKTTVKRRTCNPVYNEALIFDVPQSNIEEVSLIIQVMDYDRIGPNEFMGCAGLGANLIGIGRDHWLTMLDNPRDPVAQWHPLMETIPGIVPPVKNGRGSIIDERKNSVSLKASLKYKNGSPAKASLKYLNGNFSKFMKISS